MRSSPPDPAAPACPRLGESDVACPRCGAPMLFVKASWHCERCRFKEGCCS